MSKDLTEEIRDQLDKAGGLKHLAEPDISRLAEAGVESFEGLLETLEDPTCDIELGRICAWALGQLSDEKATTQLLKALTDDDASLRWEVAKSLGIIRSKRAVVPLLDRLTNAKTSEEKSAAAYALGLIGDKRALGPLLSVLEDRNQLGVIRGHAAEALAPLQDNEAVPALVQGLKDDSPEVRFWCAYALGELGDKRALQAHEELATTDETTLPGWGTVGQEAASAAKSIKSAMSES